MDRPVGARALDEPLAAVDAVHRNRTLQPHLGDSNYDPPDHAYLSNPASPPSAALGDASSYKELKEAWIADQTGSSIHLVNTLGLVMLATYAIWAVLRAKRIRFVRTQHRRQPYELDNPILTSVFSAAAKLTDWQLEYLILIVPAVSGHTVLASHLVLTNIVLVSVLLFLAYSGPKLVQNSQTVQDKKKHKRHWSKKYSDDEDDDEDPTFEHPSTHTDPSHLTPHSSAAEAELPFRVSIDSAADAAHASAAPPNFYDGPGSSSFRSDGDLSSDTSISPTPQSPILGSANSAFLPPSSTSETTLLSPNMASSSTFSSPTTTRRSVELTALKTGLMQQQQQQHSRDASDVQSVVSASSAMSSLARSVVDPRGKGKQQASSPTDEASSPSSFLHDPTSHATTFSSSRETSDQKHNTFIRPQPFLTVYRAHMMLVTIISILAVDFPVFPRILAKCESWGTSWMDMGVGSFVFSLGIISALPFLKSPQNRFRPLKQQLVGDFKKALPLVVLGGVRVGMVKGVEYPEHVTEYGVHWNFFITISLLPFAATLSRPFSRFIRYSILGLGLSLSHQVLLMLTRWQEWALASDIKRSGLLEQNKEGLTSMVGYLAIFYIGLDLGHYVLPLDPYFAYRKFRKTCRRSKPKTNKLAMVLASLAILWWLGFLITDKAMGLRTSRRLANLPYVLWVVAFNTSFLLCYVLIYWFILQPLEQKQTSEVVVDSLTPKLLDDLNKHSLTIFLIANLLTGLVNLTTKTMYTRDSVALLILLVYTGICCTLAKFMSARGVRLKF